MYVVGIVVNTGSINAAVYDVDSYKIVGRAECGLSGEKSMASLASELCKTLLSDMKIDASDVRYVGVATDEGFDICADIEKELSIKTFGETLCNARALGEAYTSGDKSSLVMLSIEDGIKSSIIMDKRLFTKKGNGEDGFAHMVIAVDGLACDCGTKGCFEAYVGERGVKNIAREVGITEWQSITAKTLFAMSDDAAKKAQSLYSQYLAVGLTNIINLFQPEELVIEGDFFAVGDALVKPTMDIVQKEQYTRFSPNQCKIRAAVASPDVALIGAALINR